MKLSHLLPHGTYRSSACADEIEICGLCDHTDEVKEGYAFIAKRGKSFDPLLLLSKLEQGGICAVILEEGHPIPFESIIPLFFVQDISATASDMWNRYYRQPGKDLCLIGITGTNGKTTTAHILAHLLNASGKKSGYIGTLGVYSAGKERADLKEGNMTTPCARYLFRALRALRDDGCECVVLEVSSHALMQKRVRPLSFSLSVFTNLSEDHLDYHLTEDAYFEAKALLFKQSLHALINVDDEHGRKLYKRLVMPKSSYGILNEAHYQLTELNENASHGAQYTCRTSTCSFPVKTSLHGSFNLYNSLAATSAAVILGACPNDIAKGFLSLPKIPGRMEVVPLEKYGTPFTVIIDYAHTPDAMEAVLRSARRLTRGRVIALFGAGGDREKEKRGKMGKIAEKYADFVFITTDNSRSEAPLSIIRDILSGMAKKERRRVICNRKNAIEEALTYAKAGDTLLLLGKGHEEYVIDKTGQKPFSERAIIENFFKKRGSEHGC